MANSKRVAEHLESKLVLRPVLGLTNSLSKADVEWITIRAIKKHRQLRNIAEAQERESKCAPSVDAPPETVGVTRLSFIEAMINMHAQQTVVSTLLDLLGYIPTVSDDTEPA